MHRPSGKLRFLACIAAVVTSIAAEAVVIDSGDGTGNTTAPPDDFGFENVGSASGLSGIYLGDGWVLTANHVGAVPITLLGVTYSPVPGSGVRLTNTSGPPPDLYVYRINGFPALPPVVLSSSTPLIGESVSCTGRGWTRQPNTTTWNSSWQEDEEPSPVPAYKGYKALGFATRRWGTNLVTATGIVALDTSSIIMMFDDVGGTDHESQAVPGDSGGGCFAERSGTWELVGVMFAMLVCPDQPSGTAIYVSPSCGTPPFNGNGTVAADVAFYRTQIESLTPPLGDVPALPPVAVGALAALLVLAARALHTKQR